MRIIFDGPEEHFDAAVRLLREEFRDWRVRYDRPGWGWVFHRPEAPGMQFFVRGIKGGMSVRINERNAPGGRHPAHRDSKTGEPR